MLKRSSGEFTWGYCTGASGFSVDRLSDLDVDPHGQVIRGHTDAGVVGDPPTADSGLRTHENAVEAEQRSS
jgi:hypothetical protein